MSWEHGWFLVVNWSKAACQTRAGSKLCHLRDIAASVSSAGRARVTFLRVTDEVAIQVEQLFGADAPDRPERSPDDASGNGIDLTQVLPHFFV